MFMRTTLPIGILFSASLIFSNSAYLYLSVAYIQMLKVCLRRRSPTLGHPPFVVADAQRRHSYLSQFSSSNGRSACKNQTESLQSSSA